jgi:hypothetical protein
MADFTTTSTASGRIINALILVAAGALLAVGAIYFMQDHRPASQRIGDAVGTLPAGPGKAVDKLRDQPPAANLKRNVTDAVS